MSTLTAVGLILVMVGSVIYLFARWRMERRDRQFHDYWEEYFGA